MQAEPPTGTLARALTRTYAEQDRHKWEKKGDMTDGNTTDGSSIDGTASGSSTDGTANGSSTDGTDFYVLC